MRIVLACARRIPAIVSTASALPEVCHTYTEGPLPSEGAVYSADTRVWRTQTFPRPQPASREDALLLTHALDALLAEVASHPHTPAPVEREETGAFPWWYC